MNERDNQRLIECHNIWAFDNLPILHAENETYNISRLSSSFGILTKNEKFLIKILSTTASFMILKKKIFKWQVWWVAYPSFILSHHHHHCLFLIFELDNWDVISCSFWLDWIDDDDDLSNSNKKKKQSNNQPTIHPFFVINIHLND